jgi:large subunit ribosomal protein L17
MRHLCKGRKLKRTASHRKALLCNLATSLFKNDSKRIKTTVAKAKEARKLVDSLITKAKRATASGGDKLVPAKREIYKVIKDRAALASIFTDVVPKVMDRPGGYTRIVKIGRRLGDAAELAILELVDFNLAQEKETTTKTKEKKGLLSRVGKKKEEKDSSKESEPTTKKKTTLKTDKKKSTSSDVKESKKEQPKAQNEEEKK